MEVKLLLVIAQCLTLALIYVLSLYVWKYHPDRNHPLTIKRRFISVIVVNLFSPVYLWICLDKKYLEKNTLWQLMGIRLDGLLQAIFYTLFLTMTCFLGPLVADIVKGSYDCRKYPLKCPDIFWYRNIIVAPISEEVTYRACLIPILSQYFQPLSIIFICPIFFGAAHFNHFMELIKEGKNWKLALYISCFQFLYTTMFGAYSTFLILRTGHLVAPVVAHCFCNHMGVPDIRELFLYQGFKKYMITFFFISGIILWCIFLLPITNPQLYSNNIYWTQNFYQ